MMQERLYIANWKNIINNMDNKQIQLFLVPFAGGNLYSFKNLDKHLDSRIDVVPIEYAGRGARMNEPFILDYSAFLEDVSLCIKKKRSKTIPFCIFGYSLGSAIVYDLLEKQMLSEQPRHVFICAREALNHESKSQRYNLLSEDEFLQKVIDLGGMNQQILGNRRFLDIYMKPLRADYRIWGQYRYSVNNRLLTEDITMFYSEKDTPFKSVEGWQDLTSGKVVFYEFGDNHFFINNYYKEMAEIINQIVVSQLEDKGVK